MDLKQSMINIGYKIDDSNLTEAKQRTDALIQALGQQGVSAVNRFNAEVGKAGDDLDRVNDKTKAWLTINDKIKQSSEGITAANGNVQKSLDENLVSINRLRTFADDTKDKFNANADAIKSMNAAMNSPIGSVDKFNDKLSRSLEISKQLGSSLSGGASYSSNRVNDTEEKPERAKSSGVGSMVGAGLLGGVVGGAAIGITGYIKEHATAAYQIAAAAEKTQLAWHTMGVNSTADVKQLTGQVAELRKQADVSGASTTAAQKNIFNATNGNIGQTKALTNEMFALGRSTGQTDDQIVQATGSLGRLFNTAKVRGNTFTRITKQMPAMRDAIIKASGESSAKFMADMDAGKISGSQLRDLMVKAAGDSGEAWDKYGKTADGAIAKLKGSEQQIWISTMAGVAGTANQGLIQLSNLVQKNEKPISDMMAVIGKGLTNVASDAITFLVKNQKPLGQISSSLVSIVGTIGKGVWDTFSGVVQTIGKAFGAIDGNSKDANNPLQTTANLLNDIAQHKTAIKLVAGAFTTMFVTKKAIAFADSLKKVAGAVGLINAAQQDGSKQGILNSVLQNQTSTGRILGIRKNQALSKDFKYAAKESTNKAVKSDWKLANGSLGSNLGSLGSDVSLAAKEKPAFGAAKEIESTGRFGKFGSLTGLALDDGSQLIKNKGTFGAMGKIGRLTSSVADKSGSLLSDAGKFINKSPILSKVGGIASKIPVLDAVAAGTQLIGMNRHNAGGKIGSAGGMLAGTMGGSAAGAAIGSVIPGVGTAIGGAVGGIAGGLGGTSVGKWIGKSIQGSIPKGLFSGIGKSWNDTINSIQHSSFAKSISKDLTPIGKSFGSMWDTIKKTTSSTWSYVAKSFAPVGKAFGSMWNVIKPIAESSIKMFGSMLPHVVKGFGTVFSETFKLFGGVVGSAFKIVSSVLSGAFKSISGIFETFSGIFTGNWKETWKGVKDIFGGVWDAISGTFTTVINGIKNTLSGFFKGVGKFVEHPIQSIKEGLGFATGTTGRYPNGLPKATNAVVNDGNGPELISFGGNLGMYKGRNVHTILPKGSHVFNADDTKKIVGTQHFAAGTTSLNRNTSLFSAKIDTKNPVKDMKSLSDSLTMTNAKMQGSLVDATKKGTKQVQDLHDDNRKNLIKTNTDVYKQLDPIWNKTTKAFGDDWNALGGYSQNAMQGAVDALNKGISGIDSSLQQFGGNDSVLSPIHYANGTGVVDNDHIAMVNDAKQGAQTEAIVNQAGDVRYAKGTDALTVIHKGESVLNGTDTAEAIRHGWIPRYAKGKSSKSALRSIAKKNAKDPTGAFNSEFTSHVQGLGSTLAKGLTKMSSNAVSNVKTGYNWSNAMWKTINSVIKGNDGSASGLLAAVEKYGTGKKYVLGATGPDSFDCSGLVQYALKHAFGIDYPRVSGAQIDKARSISRSDAEPGDLIGNSEHIGVVADKGAHHYFSAFNPSSHPNILMTPVNGAYFPGTPKFGRVAGISNKHSSNKGSGLKGVSPMMKKLVESQLGSAALSSITKTLGSSDGGASGNPAGDGVQRWTSDVKKALGSLNLSTDSSMVDRVLRQISTESSGNPNAVGGTDGLSDGRAMGLMQVKPGTFAAYGKPDLGKWNNGYASIYAGLNYAKHRYGDSLSYLGQGHGYANGGNPPINEPVLVGERGPELVQFDSPARVKSNADSINALRRGSSNHDNSVTIGKGAIQINISGAGKHDTSWINKVGNEVEKRLRMYFNNANAGLAR